MKCKTYFILFFFWQNSANYNAAVFMVSLLKRAIMNISSRRPRIQSPSSFDLPETATLGWMTMYEFMSDSLYACRYGAFGYTPCYLGFLLFKIICL